MYPSSHIEQINCVANSNAQCTADMQLDVAYSFLPSNKFTSIFFFFVQFIQTFQHNFIRLSALL